MVYMLGKTHGVVDAQSMSPDGDPATNMEDQMANASFFLFNP